MSAGAERFASSKRVRFAARGLLAACVGEVRVALDPELAAEIRMRRGVAGVARVYDEAGGEKGGKAT